MADANTDTFGVLGTGAYSTYSSGTAAPAASKGDSLGKEDFLKLLVAQLTQQDPTNPMKDTEFVAQLATYSGLEQQMNMNKNLETLVASAAAGTAASAVSLIGTVVGYTGEDGSLKTGMVSFLDIVGGEVNLYLADGTYIPFKSVEQVGYPIIDKSGEPAPEEKTEKDPADTTDPADPAAGA